MSAAGGTFQGAIRDRQARRMLETSELRMIVAADLDRLERFVRSAGLHAIDAKGDTPLHIAARMGNLALCDLFIRSGADPNALNFDRETFADVAAAEGH